MCHPWGPCSAQSWCASAPGIRHPVGLHWAALGGHVEMSELSEKGRNLRQNRGQGGRTVRCARAVQEVGCFPPPVATGPRVLHSAPPMRFCIDHARFCRVPGINNVIIGTVRKRPQGQRCGHSVAQTTLATTEAPATPASTTKEQAQPAEVRTTIAETTKARAMPTCTTGRGGVIGPRAHGNMRRQVADNQDTTRRVGAIGLLPHGNAARHAVDNLDVKESGQQKPQHDRCNNQHNPQCTNYWAPLNKAPRNTRAVAIRKH